MPFVLTEDSILVCTHQGTVRLTAGQSKVKVGGAKVLVDGDLGLAQISGCITVPTSAPAPVSIKCLKVDSTIGGVATKLKVQGKGLLLDNIQGFTNGIVANAKPQSWSVQTAGQIKLKTA